jgi:predicted DNA-binding WGR domain protein
MTCFTRSEPAKNFRRFYIVRLAPTLFGDWTVLREWGRSGSPGTVRVRSFVQYHDAQSAEQRIIKRRLRAAILSMRPEHAHRYFHIVRKASVSSKSRDRRFSELTIRSRKILVDLNM